MPAFFYATGYFIACKGIFCTVGLIDRGVFKLGDYRNILSELNYRDWGVRIALCRVQPILHSGMCAVDIKIKILAWLPAGISVRYYRQTTQHCSASGTILQADNIAL